MSQEDEMKVKKRNGKLEDIRFDKILNRLKKLGQEGNIHINFSALVMKIIDQLYDGISTTEIDTLCAQQCATMNIQHPDYGKLAGFVSISNYQKNTNKSFFSTMKQVYNHYDSHKKHVPYISHSLWKYIEQNKQTLEDIIDHQRDYLIDYFGFKTLERVYLIKLHQKPVERIQHMWLRVSIALHMNSFPNDKTKEITLIKETYDMMSQKYFIHATPTLFNAGTKLQQLSSCYLIAMEDDSIHGIYNTLKDCALISKNAGGIGLHIHNIRAKDSPIYGTNGTSNGIVPMLRVFNSTARYCDQGGGRRAGSFAIYLEPWHADIFDFLEMRKNHGDEELKARDLFYAIWMPDLFMQRVKENGKWSLMCPNKSSGLSDVYSDEFKKLYEKYEEEGKYEKQVDARELWLRILDAQMETGTPYIVYKDHCNEKNNQKNLGIIKSSNLCTEITLYSDAQETAVCNLASIALNQFVNKETKEYDFQSLYKIAKMITRNLNQVIDRNYYPTEKTERSNMKHRPIGIGVQGLADVFLLMDIAYVSDEARQLNKEIFETIYYGAMEASCELSEERNEIMKQICKYYTMKKFTFTSTESHCREIVFDVNITEEERKLIESIVFVRAEVDNEKIDFFKDTFGSYSSFEGSPLSNGLFQFDLWNVKPIKSEFNWNSLREKVIKYGVRNSMLIAPMPTASTSQILGNNECFEPYTNNIYSRRTMSGDFIVINKHLIMEMIERGLWTDEVKNSIIKNRGSVQQLDIDERMKKKYMQVWEMPMKHMIDMSVERGPYVCQSQSLNLWVENPNYKILNSMHFYGWEKGLKTGIYYLRRMAKAEAQQFTIEPEKQGECEMCSA